jgi:excisionase family DNA binding protein
MEKAYLDINELSEYLNVKRSTLYAKLYSWGLPHYRVGRLIRFRKDEVDQWMSGLRHDIVSSTVKVKGTQRIKKDAHLDIDALIKRAIDQSR